MWDGKAGGIWWGQDAFGVPLMHVIHAGFSLVGCTGLSHLTINPVQATASPPGKRAHTASILSVNLSLQARHTIDPVLQATCPSLWTNRLFIENENAIICICVDIT